jgi:ribosome biogenesis GTPase
MDTSVLHYHAYNNSRNNTLSHNCINNIVAKRKKLTKVQKRRVSANQKKRLQQSDADIQIEGLGAQLQGVVVSRFGQHADIESLDLDSKGKIVRCNIRRNITSLVTGDKVLWRKGDENLSGISGIVEAVEDRTSVLLRPDYYDGRKPVAANIDQIFIVSSVLPAFTPTIIDRYLVAAEEMGIRPIILLNKVDLLSEELAAEIDPVLDMYRDIGYQVMSISAKLADSVDVVKPLLKNNVSIFVGQSGVGKSSLVNALMPEADVLEGAVSENSGLGQHTTTVARLYHFPSGGELIDSPGIRDFALWHLDEDLIAQGFIEFQDYLGGCKFRDCKHLDDPGCALREALNKGAISQLRFDSYHKIMESMEQKPTNPLLDKK